MNSLQSEILLTVFKNLNSREMLDIMTVCKNWLDIINENRKLWSRLVIPIDEIDEGDWKDGNDSDGYADSLLSDDIDEYDFRVVMAARMTRTTELFDRKSQSTLEEVSMDGRWFKSGKQKEQLTEILSRSKETLHTLNLPFKYYDYSDQISDLSWKLPQLVDFRALPNKKIQLTPLSGRGNQLKVLWIYKCQMLFGSHLHLLDNLVSLKVKTWEKGSEWRRILDKPSQTLRHLSIKVETDHDNTKISDLEFPSLKVMEIKSKDETFPSWFIVTTSSFTLINRSELLSDLPSISNLWIDDRWAIPDAANECPELVVLRADVRRTPKSQLGGRSMMASAPGPGAGLIRMLENRKKNVEAGKRIRGIQMKQIKTLFVPFDQLLDDEDEEDDDELTQLKGLVEEVIDLRSAPSFIEVDV